MDNKREEYQYRIFISYSREDKDRVEKLVKILKENGLNPLYDRHLEGGFGFTDQIKKFISHAHVFMPLITESSSQKGWVHQEIGYATAFNVPIMPVMIDIAPGAMLQQVQALQWDDNEENLKEIMSFERFRNLVEDAQKSMSQDISPFFECGLLRDDRTKLMVRYALDVSRLGFSGHVRQRGALSSFHIPDKSLSDPVWPARYGPKPPGEYRYRWLRRERQELEKHAKASGCSIIIDPYFSYTEYGTEAMIVRLEELLEFLRSMPDDKVNVGISKGLPKEGNLTTVGDWFAAEAFSVSVDKGYLQTMFTRHAPFVRNCIKAFDEELEYLLKKQGTSCSSREYAIQTIEQVVDELKKELNI